MRRRPFGPKTPATRARRPRRAELWPEHLEARQLLTGQPPSVLTVTSLDDTDTGDPASGQGTLRWVIGQANLFNDTNTINFQLDPAAQVGGVWTIQPATPLPTITAPVFLNGLVGASTTPQIVLDGSDIPAGTTANGLALAPGTDSNGAGEVPNNSTVVGLVIENFNGAGVSVSSANNVTVRNSYIGTDATGAHAAPNGVGVLLTNVQSATVGGTSANTGNLISGNTTAGVRITGSTSQANNIQGNKIGLNLDGSAALPNGVGVEIDGSASNTVGGASSTARNTISGNTGAGVRVVNAGASNNAIQNNYIGTDLTGVKAMPNGEGVFVGSGATSTTVGGLSTTLRNVISGNADYGIEIAGATGTSVVGNYVGLKFDGSAAVTGGGQGKAGILVRDGATSTTVGGTSTLATNVISGNGGPGVWVRGKTGGSGSVTGNTTIVGNVIGTDSTGTIGVGNVQGVAVTDGATSTTIGGTVSTASNLISGNSSDGILLASFDTTGAVVQGNHIGLAKDNTTPLGNAGNGIRIDGASNNQVGGTLSGAGNTIASNAGAGVWVQSGNGNAIRRNVIQNNGGLGIDLGAQGVTPNNSGSTANNGQNFPVLSAVQTTGGSTKITGTLQAAANQTYILEFYSDPSPDPSGHGEGPTYLGTTTVTTGTDGNASFTATASSVVPIGTAVTATATAQNGSGVATSTSEFAANVTNVAPQADLALTQSASTSATQPNSVGAGGIITYTLVVTNNGPSTAGSTTVTDTLPTGVSFLGGTSTTGSLALSSSGGVVTFNLGDLASGSTATMTITAVAPSTIPSPNTISNVAVASQSGSASDSSTGNNTSTLTTTVLAGVNLSVAQVALPNPASIGTETAFVLTLTNSSSTQAHGVVLTDTLPAGFTYTRNQTTQGTVAVANGQVVADLGDLPPASTTGTGYSARVVIYGIPTQTGGLTNTATITSTDPLIVPGSANSSLTLAAVPSLATAAAPPHVLNVVRLGHRGFTQQVVIGFDQTLNAVNATNLLNYVLGSLGNDGKFGTKDDALIGMRPPQYDATAQTVTLTLARPIQARRTLGLAVNGLPPSGIINSNGVLLDGNDDGVPGGNYVTFLPGQAPTKATSGTHGTARAKSVPQGPRSAHAGVTRGR